MGFKSLTTKLAATAVKITGDLRVTVVYSQKAAGVYNPITDTETGAITTVTFQTVLAKGTEVENDYVRPIDAHAKLLVPSVLLGTIIPNDSDSLTIDGVPHEITGIRSVPGDALYIMSVRTP